MIEDKAGWGLVPGLQALLLHILTAAAAQWAAPTTAGLGWAGCAGARLHSAARRAEESHSARTGLGSQEKLPTAEFTFTAHCAFPISSKASRTAEIGSFVFL
ncbi:unnamed protein product [Rangifer tarandus platyrhynchus]|uniref:Uncharacterized protein n=1 Tax=Rangifer tarandus platyrhynchus TaxID=3082113 RepID=A0AC60A412_RANTA